MIAYQDEHGASARVVHLHLSQAALHCQSAIRGCPQLLDGRSLHHMCHLHHTLHVILHDTYGVVLD